MNGPADEEQPGNALTITLEHEHITEVFSGFGEKGVSAESVAKRAVDAARSYLSSEAVVGRHLADQLLLPMALVGGGEFTTLPVTHHFESHVTIAKAFLNTKIATESTGDLVRVRVGGWRRNVSHYCNAVRSSRAASPGSWLGPRANRALATGPGESEARSTDGLAGALL